MRIPFRIGRRHVLYQECLRSLSKTNHYTEIFAFCSSLSERWCFLNTTRPVVPLCSKNVLDHFVIANSVGCAPHFLKPCMLAPLLTSIMIYHSLAHEGACVSFAFILFRFSCEVWQVASILGPDKHGHGRKERNTEGPD